MSSTFHKAILHLLGKRYKTKRSLHFLLSALNRWKDTHCKISFPKSVSVTCESRGTQTGCFYGLPLKLSRNLSWLFLTFSCLQQRSDVRQHVSFTEHLFSAHCCLPSLETENKDPFSSAHSGWVCSPRNVLHLPWAGGTMFNTVCSTPQPCQVLQWSPGTTGSKRTSQLPCDAVI